MLNIKLKDGSSLSVPEGSTALDAAKLPEIIGTIAGDDTIFVATASGENAVMLREDMQKLISGGN